MRNQSYTADELYRKTEELKRCKRFSSLVATLGAVLVSYSLITSSIKSLPNMHNNPEKFIQYNLQKMHSEEINPLERGLLNMEQSIHPVNYKKSIKIDENKTEDNQTKGIRQILLGLGIMFTGGSFSSYFDKRREEYYGILLEKNMKD